MKLGLCYYYYFSIIVIIIIFITGTVLLHSRHKNNIWQTHAIESLICYSFLCIIFTLLFVYFFVICRVLLLIGSTNYTKELKTTELTHTFGGGNTVQKYNKEQFSLRIMICYLQTL